MGKVRLNGALSSLEREPRYSPLYQDLPQTERTATSQQGSKSNYNRTLSRLRIALAKKNSNITPEFYRLSVRYLSGKFPKSTAGN